MTQAEAIDPAQRFKDALRHFQKIADPDGQTGPIFAAAYKARENASVPGPDHPEWEKKSKPFQPFHEQEGYIGPTLLFYLRDAVELYERRHDEYEGQTALLFDPSAFHIRALRHIIDVLKGPEYGYPEGSDEYNAAIAVEEALNRVQETAYVPKTAKKDNAKLHVSGYGISTRSDRPHGNGFVVREYGSWEKRGHMAKYKGQAVIEIGSDAVMQHLRECNAVYSYGLHNNMPVDMAVITQDGEAQRFNYSDQRKLLGWYDIFQLESGHPRPDLLGRMEHVVEDANSRLDADTVKFVEQEMLPMLVEHRPPLTGRQAQAALE